MIKIINPAFFTFKVETSIDKDSNPITLVSIFTDPIYFELPQYKKASFISIVIKNKHFNEEINKCKKSINEYKDTVKCITQYLSSNSFIKHSQYDINQSSTSSNRYYFLKSLFDVRNRYHTMIFEDVIDNEVCSESCNIAVIGYPVSGIIQPIPKLWMYDMYNGSLVVLNNNPFTWRSKEYNKLMYCMVNIYSVFTFSEYIKHPMHDDRLSVITTLIALDINHEEDNTETQYFSISEIKNEFNIDSKFLEYYTGKINKNIFYLTDIPRDRIKMSGSEIGVKIDSNEDLDY